MDYFVKAYKDWKLHSQFHEIVPDMDDEFMFNEKQSIRDSARSLKKYGSTCCNHQLRNNETLVRHEIEKTDTLQGIALKYGCTTEQIRRANRLFASDSLFLRQFLLIPVEKSSPYYPNASSITTAENENNLHNILESVDDGILGTGVNVSGDPLNCTPSSTLSSASASSSSMCSDNNPRPAALPTRPYSIAGELLVQTNDDDSTLSNCNNGNNKQSKSLDSVAAVMSPEEESRRSINEFLSKIDNTISESRKYVEKSKETISNQTDDDLFVVATDVVTRRRNNNLNNSYKKEQNQQPHHIRHSSTGSNSDTAQLLNTTQLRKVQNSLKKLEKQQDDFFEL